MIEQASELLHSELASTVPADRLLTDAAGRAAYTVQGVTPGCVVAPGTQEELSAVLQVAHRHRAVVVPWGGGTQQNIGAPPERIDLVVRTERLCNVLTHEPNDLTISVQAGMTLAALREHLARYGQMLPIDPPLAAQATIGGLIATAADGPRRLGYGTLRDLLIGITVVEADGRISKGGGMVVKNVSGFDMMKLYLGSFGTLAIVASANFKLMPIPPAAATLLCLFATPADAFAALEALHLTQLTPTAAEYLNNGALRSLEFDGACALALRAEGLPAAVERHMADMAVLAQRNRASHTHWLKGAQEVALWARIADLTQVAALAGDEALLKLTALPAEVDRLIDQLEGLAATTERQAIVNARAFNGVIYARLQPVDAERLQHLVNALPAVQWVATTIPNAPRWGAPPPGLDLMRHIKAEFDPCGMLNRGRFIDAI